MDGIKRKGKILMGSSDLSLVIYEQKILHETQSKVLPCQNKVSTALLKWSYTESNANIPNLYSCWSDLDLAIQTLAQESIDHSVEYRKVFKDINLEGKRLNEIQKEKESSAKKVSGIKKQIESAKKSKKGADKVKLANLEAELSLASSKDTEMGRLLITKTKEYEEHKATLLQESSLAYCDKSLEALDKLRQVIEAKREVASAMTTKPIYNGDQIKGDGISTVENVFKTLDMQLPAREPALDRRRCFGLGTRSSILDSSSVISIPSTQSPNQPRTFPRGTPPITKGTSPSMQPGHTGTLGSNSSSAVYQGGDELGLSDESDDDHDYQIPNEELFGKKKHNISVDSQEEEYLAPEFPIEPQSCPRVPPRQESMQSIHSFDSSAGTSEIPGDYMIVVQEEEEEQPRMPTGPETSRSSTDSSNSSSSTGPGRPSPIKLPRLLPSSNSTADLVEGEDFCRKDRKSPGVVQKSPGVAQKSQELQAKVEKEAKEKEAAMIKRKPQPLPKPAVDVKPKPKPKPKPSPTLPTGVKDKPVPLPRASSSEQEPHDEDAGGFYEIMSAADAQKIQMAKDKNGLPKITSTYDPEETTNHHGDYYSEVYERDQEDSDSDGDYCVADFHNFKRSDSTAAEEEDRRKSTLENKQMSQAALNNNRKPSEEGDMFTDDEDDEAIYCNVPS